MISNRQLFLRHVAQTSESSLQFEIEKAEGIYFYDKKGRPYLDLVSGVAVSALGHGHPKVKEAVKKQADRYMHTMVYGEFVQSPQVEYAEWLAKHLPDRLDNVYFVNSGSEAIELYNHNLETGHPFDVVLMDLTIPGGMGGGETIKKLLEIDPDVKAIVSSGYSNDPIMANFKEYGFRGCLAKPYKMQDLNQILQQVLSRK